MKSKLKVENSVVLAFSIFHAIAGGAWVFILVASKLIAPPHIGVLAFLSFITAYGLIQMRKWAVLLTTILFFLGTASTAPVLYASIKSQTFSPSLGALLFNLALIVYVVLLLFAFVYVAAKREKFE
ncbi:MAG: hypothetical protein ACE5IF_01440 [Candidatus Bathyarchaeia archaeon]